MAGTAVEVAVAPARPRPARLHRLASLGMLVTIAATVAYLLRFNPTDRVADPTGPCLWHALTGINGPTCGGTRMVWYLLHGDLIQAARHHVVALVALPFLGYAFVRWMLQAWLVRTLPPLRLRPWMYVAYGAVWLGYAVVLRNLPWAPLSWFNIANLTP